MERETKAILDAIRCVGGDQGLVYMTVPITTGLREYVLMRKLDCDRLALRSIYRSRWLEEVVGPNEADAEAYARMIQIRNQGRLVLNPASMMIEGWSQQDFTSLWNKVLVEFCDLLVVTPDWAYSSGSIGEVSEMALLGREITDVLGRRLSNQQLMDTAGRAREGLLSMGFDQLTVSELLPELRLPDRRSISVRRFPGSEWDASISWILREIREVENMSHYDDDAKSRADGPHLSAGLWRQQLDKYLIKAKSLGIDSPEGGIALAQFATVSVAMMQSFWRVFGAFPEPGHARGSLHMSRIPDQGDINSDSLALVVAWLRREHFYTSQKYGPQDDDMHSSNSSFDEYWWRQLEWYYRLAAQEGLDTLQGRQNFGKYVSTAMNFVVSRIRVNGPLRLPTRPSMDELFS